MNLANNRSLSFDAFDIRSACLRVNCLSIVS